MITDLKSILKSTVRATDGEIGKVVDFYLDDFEWRVRYMVVDAGSRHVLLRPSDLGDPRSTGHVIPVDLTRERVLASPGLDHARPISRQQEADLYQYYGWSPYWGGSMAPMTGPGPMMMAPVPVPVTGQDNTATPQPVDQTGQQTDNPHLRSLREVAGHHLHARDGTIGKVDTFLVDTQDWNILYMVADTGGWLTGRKVLVAPTWIRQINWADGRVDVDLSRETIRTSPDYQPGMTFDTSAHEQFRQHYGDRRPS